jgi:hypothetical protein
MILPDFILSGRVNQRWQYSGIDSPADCLNKTHFEQYPHCVSYQYNSRGFRDLEWPNSIDELKQSIWCVGDSFTVGIGSPIEHTWPWLLQKQTGTRTINVSMDGASNNWIARKTIDILQKINPHCVIIHWSYLGRREFDLSKVHNNIWNKFYRAVSDPSWPKCENLADFEQLPDHIRQEINTVHGGIPVPDDEDLRCHYQPYATDSDDLTNTIQCINQVNSSVGDSLILHSFIPEFSQYPSELYQYLDQTQIKYIPEISRLDYARDYHHYDTLTSQAFVSQITNWMTDAKCQ